MSLASHAKTSLTDPGSVPMQAIPSERQRLLKDSHSMCGQCQTFKPPGSHHCRICNRCISRMDHHCPWMNNCVGAANLKHFLLFLCYTWLCATYSLVLFGWNYFFCADEDCTFHPLVVHLVRIMTLLALGAFLFTSSMLMNVLYGVLTGIGTIDRLKKKATNTMSQSEEEPIQLIDVSMEESVGRSMPQVSGRWNSAYSFPRARVLTHRSASFVCLDRYSELHPYIPGLCQSIPFSRTMIASWVIQCPTDSTGSDSFAS